MNLKKKIICQSQATDLKVEKPEGSVGGFCLTDSIIPSFGKSPIKCTIPYSVPSYREVVEQLKVFPEAKEYLIQQTKLAKKILRQLLLAEQQGKYIISRKTTTPESKQFWTDVLDVVIIGPDKKKYETILKCNTLLLSVKTDQKYSIEKAKEFPIIDLIQFNRANMAKCIFHTDKNPSLHYYPKSNTVYCFSCNRYGDAIDVYKELNHCSTFEAIKALQ